MSTFILYLVVGGALAGLMWEEGDDDINTLVFAALWPAAMGVVFVHWWKE
jgi:hypothetical protein